MKHAAAPNEPPTSSAATCSLALPQQGMRHIGGSPAGVGTYMSLSALNAEIVGGALPEKRFS